MKTIIKTNSSKALLVTILLTGLLKFFTAGAQTPIYQRNAVQGTFRGFELSTGAYNAELHSNISELNGLKAGFFGGAVGGVLSNGRGKIKMTVGTYRSTGSIPYNIDIYRESLSGSIYLLRLKEIKAHVLEPYFSVGVSLQQSLFYGYYKPDESVANYSSTDTPYLGQTGTALANLGAGVEYQLVTDELRFVHLFLSATYSAPLSTSASNQFFSATSFSNGLAINAGVSFGIIKYRK